MNGTIYQKKLCVKQVLMALKLPWISFGIIRDSIPQQSTETYIYPEPDNVNVQRR